MIGIVGHNKMIDYIKCNLECDHSSMGIGSNFIAKVSLAQLADNTDTTYGFYTGLDNHTCYNYPLRNVINRDNMGNNK